MQQLGGKAADDCMHDRSLRFPRAVAVLSVLAGATLALAQPSISAEKQSPGAPGPKAGAPKPPPNPATPSPARPGAGTPLLQVAPFTFYSVSYSYPALGTVVAKAG